MKKIYPAKQPHSYTNHTLKKHRMTDQNTDRQQRRLTQKKETKTCSWKAMKRVLAISHTRKKKLN